ncbi:MAG: transcription antitermination factor NusB [Desulfobacteraceae bacterium]|nr:transcription antitermination factor NusB [Desulfobacteraceae bacterium]
MGTRRRSRENAMQALFYMDMVHDHSTEAMDLFVDCYQLSKTVLPFFNRLVAGVLEAKSILDHIIERFSNNWKIGRMSCVDRNVLRIAVYEMLHCEDIPLKVSINEAIDVGKRFGTEESGAFINGILDSIRIAIENNTLDAVAAEQH